MAYRPVTAQEAPLLLWQTRFDTDAEALVTSEVSSQALNQSKHWLLLDFEPVVLPPAPATLKFHNRIALVRKQDRCGRGQVADM